VTKQIESWCERDEHHRYDLFSDFNEWIESEEANEIRESYGIDALSDPSKALFAGDRKAYDQELEEYRTKRRSEVLNQAYFVEKFGDDHWFERNGEHFNQLIDRLEAGDVIPFIGAGISKAGGFPTWEEHLRTQGRTAGLDTELVTTLLAEGEYEKLIESIESKRGREVFEQEIRDAFSRTGAITQTTLLITELFTDTLITTNYDRLLEQACDTGAENAYEVINCFKAMQQTNNDRTSIIKLHGDITTPSYCILGKKQYDEAYGIGEIDMSLPIPKLLEYYYKNSSLLFLGSSLYNDRTVHVFRAIKKKLHNTDIYIPQHFCIEQAIEDEEAHRIRSSYLLQLGITPIWIEPGRYEYVEYILRMARNELRYRHKPESSDPVPLPTVRSIQPFELDLDDFLRDFSEIMPLLYWLHQQVPQQESIRYLQALQRFFIAHTIFTDTTDQQLVIGLDNLARALSSGKFDGYTLEKLRVAFNEFQKFMESIGAMKHSTTLEWNMRELIILPLHQFEGLLETPATLSEENHGAIRLTIALLRHGEKQNNASKLPDALNIEVSNYISICLFSKLGLSVPDHLHEDRIEDIRLQCKYAWEGFEKESTSFPRKIISSLLNLLKQ
jgi:NAD-dependent SIR2 family protein deacetylase